MSGVGDVASAFNLKPKKGNGAPSKASAVSEPEGSIDLSSIPNPASQGKPKPGESSGDREYLMQVLRAATARAKLISNTLDTIGIALRQKACSVEDAMLWAQDEGILDLLQFGPPSRCTGAST